MRLWTRQGVGFSLTSESVDHKKSEFFNTRDPKNRELIRAAYHSVFDEVGTDQIIWFFTERYDWFQTERNRRIEFELDVPVAEFLAVIDCLSWERIIGNDQYYPPGLLKAWNSQARQEANSTSDVSVIDRYLEKRKAEFDKKLSQQDLRAGLFLECRDFDVLCSECTVLIKHPVNPDWIVQQ